MERVVTHNDKGEPVAWFDPETQTMRMTRKQYDLLITDYISLLLPKLRHICADPTLAEFHEPDKDKSHA